MRDAWWELTARPAAGLTDWERGQILRNFFHLDADRHILPNPRLAGLLARREAHGGRERPDVARFSVQDMRDLQVLFNLAWFGHGAREDRAIIRELIQKGSGFTETEKQAVMEQQLELLQLAPAPVP